MSRLDTAHQEELAIIKKTSKRDTTMALSRMKLAQAAKPNLNPNPLSPSLPLSLSASLSLTLTLTLTQTL